MSVIKPAIQHPNLITHLLGANNYCWIYYRNGDKKLLAKPISYLQDELPDFIRTHKSVLVNPAYVKGLTAPPRQKMAGEIQLEGGLAFPISRRRWNEVAEALNFCLAGSDGGAPTQSFRISSPGSTTLKPISEKSILLITDDIAQQPPIIKMLAKSWPQYQLQTAQQSSHLTNYLLNLTEEELPTFILLDARTSTVERLQTLQRLKQDPQLCRLPIILFVLPSDTLITDGYKRQANSVITLQDGPSSFLQTVERVCRFWLQMAALPVAAKPIQVNA